MNDKLMNSSDVTLPPVQLLDSSPEEIAQRSQRCPAHNAPPLISPFQTIDPVSHQIINSAHEGIVVYGTDLRYLVWNPYMEKLSGLRASEILGRHPLEVFPFLESAGVIATLKRALRGETTEDTCFKFMLPSNGRIGWASDSSSPLRDDSGDIIGVVGIIRDITEGKLIHDAHQFLAEFDPASSGKDFFMSLARFLAESLDMEYVCIDHLSGDKKRAQTVAYYVDGNFADNLEYCLEDTPCGDVVGKTVCCFPRDVRRLYENDMLLQEMCAESYIGTTLWNAKNQPIGLIAVIGRKPLAKPELAESMLRLVSLRAAAELEQRIAAEALKKANHELERKVLERTRELQTSHDLLNDLSSQVPGIIYQFRLAPDGHISFPYVSSAAHDIYELSPDEVQTDSTSVFKRIHPDDYDELMASIYESAQTLQAWQKEFRVILPHKGLRWLISRAHPQKSDDGSVISYGFASDITERKLAENELIENRYQLIEAQRQANIGNWNWIVNSDTVTWSEHLYTITGRDPKQPCITYQDQSRMYTSESWSRFDRAVKRSLETGEPYELELELIRADGAHRTCIAKGEAIYDQNGHVAGLRGTVQDVTERLLLEQQLYQAKKLEFIGQLAAGVAHEVRNPLNAILSISEALFRETEIEDNPEYEPYILHIRTQVSRLAQLMNDLLDLGQPISAAKLQFVPLLDLCRETMELWKVSGSAENRQGVITAVEGAAALLVMADSSKLQQAIFNLLENAGIHSSAECTIILHLAVTSPDSATAVVRIIDAGKGIPEESLSRVFEPFYSDRRGGTGLGLSLVRHFIENMSGSVRIWNNVPPPGCTAELRIPLAVKEHA